MMATPGAGFPPYEFLYTPDELSWKAFITNSPPDKLFELYIQVLVSKGVSMTEEDRANISYKVHGNQFLVSSQVKP